MPHNSIRSGKDAALPGPRSPRVAVRPCVRPGRWGWGAHAPGSWDPPARGRSWGRRWPSSPLRPSRRSQAPRSPSPGPARRAALPRPRFLRTTRSGEELSVRVRGVSLAPHPCLARPPRADTLRLSGPGPPPTSKPLCQGARGSCPRLTLLARRDREPHAPLKPAGKNLAARGLGASECTRPAALGLLLAEPGAGGEPRAGRPACEHRAARGAEPPPQRRPGPGPSRALRGPGRGACSPPPPGPGRAGGWGERC